MVSLFRSDSYYFRLFVLFVHIFDAYFNALRANIAYFGNVLYIFLSFSSAFELLIGNNKLLQHNLLHE